MDVENVLREIIREGVILLGDDNSPDMTMRLSDAQKAGVCKMLAIVFSRKHVAKLEANLSMRSPNQKRNKLL